VLLYPTTTPRQKFISHSPSLPIEAKVAIIHSTIGQDNIEFLRFYALDKCMIGSADPILVRLWIL
jgi:hypothetical protein